MARRWLLLISLLAMTGGCFNPRYPEGISCSEAQTCPPGQICDVDGVCRRVAQQEPPPDAAPPVGGPQADAAPAPDAPMGCVDDEGCPDGLVCGSNGMCVSASCTDGTRNGDETGVDCGGSCPPCLDGQPCLTPGDCSSGVCDPETMTCAAVECGDEVVGGDEACDTGAVNTRTCDLDCTLPECDDGIVNPFVEVCDEGGQATETCDPDCTLPQCNDGFFNPQAEVCDEGGSTATCDADCTVPECGDRFINPVRDEECDQGGEANAICDPDCTFPACGDGVFNPGAGEEVEPPSSPASSVPVDGETCRFDFAAINQLYCAGACGETWGGGGGCQQQDADTLCKLRTGNPGSVATSFAVQPAATVPGICCPPPALSDPAMLGCVALGRFATRGVDISISVHNTNLRSTHGGGQVVTNVVCTTP